MTAAGVLLVPAYVALGVLVPAFDLLRTLAVVAVVASGALIGRWWAPAPTVVTFVALALLEEANYRGFGPGSRLGTVIEIHTDAFSPGYFLFTMVIATLLPLLGVGLRAIAPRAYERWHSYR